MKNTGIKHWSEDERPREKLVMHGSHTLSDSELIAIIINHGTKDKSALEVAREVLSDSNNDWAVLSRKSFKDLQKINGIGPAKAISILATLEIANRKQLRTSEHSIKSIQSSRDAADILTPIMRDYPHEVFYIIYLNQKNAIIHKQLLSIGGISSTTVDVRMIMKTAIEYLCSSIIIAHNHPSGNLKPSQSDIALTEQIKNAGALLNIKLLDHVIIAGNNYYSFNDDGIM